MHGLEEFQSKKPDGSDGYGTPGSWYKELNSYHWFVLVVAALGWLFDTMDQQLFNLARVPAMRELLPRMADGSIDVNLVNLYGGYATSIFLIGWAFGGLGFGVLGDRIGRVKTMLITILIYSLCTGLSALSVGFWDFAFYRFLTGLGVGGEFAVGVALVAEVMPEKARPFALGLLQALSAIGNMTAAVVGMGLGHLESTGAVGSAWRWMFVVGTLPALLAILIRRRLKEPERWQALSGDKAAKKLGSYRELFGDPRWRKNALVGLGLAFAGVVGVWGILFFVFDLVRVVLETEFRGLGLSEQEIRGQTGFWVGITSLMLNLGAFFGIYGFAYVTHYTGRRPAFAVAFILAMVTTAAMLWFINDRTDIFWMVPIAGFCQLAVFGGYAIYFPELFPTHLRSTGTSFCYNVGRFVAATGPAALGILSGQVYAGYPAPMPLRLAGITLCSVFLIGLMILPFAPETKGEPLPE